MLYGISVAEHGLTGIAIFFRSRLSGLDDLLQAGTVPLSINCVDIGVIWGAAYKYDAHDSWHKEHEN